MNYNAKLKFNIFRRAIVARMEAEQATREEILATYPRLTEDEKNELRQAIDERQV
ncbi:hypothetical protein [Peptoniphilus asaccharolyticus]